MRYIFLNGRITITLFLIFGLLKELSCVRGGGSRASRGGTRSSGSSRTVRTGFTRTSTNGFRYNGLSGTRFGLFLRRTTYWPIRRVIYGYSYSHNSNNIYYENVKNTVVISDNITKSKLDENSSIYNCNYLGTNVINCSEPMGYFSFDDNKDAWDGACCEDLQSKEPVCCIVSLAEEFNKAVVLKLIYGSFTCFIATFVLTLWKICH